MHQAVFYADRKPVVMHRADPLHLVSMRMVSRERYHALLLDENDRPWGVLSSRDVARALFVEAEEGIEILEAGALGRVLENLSRYYASHPVLYMDPGVSIGEALAFMVSKNIGFLPLINNRGVLHGALDERSLSKAVPEYTSLSTCDLVSWEPVTIDSDEEIEVAMGLMLTLGIRRLLVREGDSVTGMVSLNQVLKYILREDVRTILLSGDTSPVEKSIKEVVLEPWIVDCSYSLREVASIISFHPLGAVLVKDEEKGRMGILTERDLLLALAEEINR